MSKLKDEYLKIRHPSELLKEVDRHFKGDKEFRKKFYKALGLLGIEFRHDPKTT